MAALGPVQAPVELFHAVEATLQVAQIEICFQSKITFLRSMLLLSLTFSALVANPKKTT